MSLVKPRPTTYCNIVGATCFVRLAILRLRRVVTCCDMLSVVGSTDLKMVNFFHATFVDVA